MTWFIAAWLKSDEPLAETGTCSRIGAGAVMKTGCPASAKLAAARKHPATNRIFTPKSSFMQAFLQIGILRRFRNLQCGRELAENEGRKAEKEKKADHIRNCRQHDRGGQSRVDTQRLESERNQNTGYPCGDHV
jgi:hypothetical protein